MKKIAPLIIVVFSFSLAPNTFGQCDYTLEMNDTFGDGWNGNTIDVLVNGIIVLDNVTLTDGYQDSLTFSVNTGDDVTTIWNEDGDFWFETSYRILDNDGAEVGSGAGTNITTGTITAICPFCAAPVALTTSAITISGADLGWTETGTSTVWDLEIGPSGFTPTGIPTNDNVNGNPFTWSGGTSSTSYEFYVRADCTASGASDLSSWIGPFSFITLPSCGDTWFDTGGSGADYANNESTLITICPTIIGEVVIANFSNFNTEDGFDGMVIYNGNDTTGLIISSGLAVGSDTINCPAGSYYGTISPGTVTSTAANGCLTFWFRSDAATVSSGWEATFSCILPPDCIAPSPLIATDITASGATLGWTENGTATFWDLEIGLSGFLPTGVPTDNDVNTNSFLWSAGASMTTYDLYVRSDCAASGGTGQSSWVGPLTFTTYPTCGDTWYDTGGSGGDYGDHENIKTTVCPINGGEVVIGTFSNFNTEDGFDGMVIYNGATTMDSVISSGLVAGSDTINCPAGSYYGTTSPGTVTSTAANGCLTFWFRSDAATVSSGWDVTFSCTPAPDCIAPSPLMATNMTSSGATLGWTENGAATFWDLEIDTSGFLPTGIPTENDVNLNPFTWSGGSPLTDYDFYVRSDCAASGGTGQSTWVGPFTFSTVCGVYTPNYAEDFASFIPICWEEDEGPITGPIATGSAEWVEDGFANNGTTGAAKFNLWDKNDTDWLISPTFDLTGGGFVVSVDVAVTDLDNTDPSAMGSDDQVLLMQSIDGGMTWTTIYIWDAGNTPSNTGDNVSVDITLVTSATTVFAFWANEGSVDDPEDYDFFVDNFKIQPPGPVNNALCNATPLIMGAPCTGDIYSNVFASLETNEPAGDCFSGVSHSVWFSFAAPASGRVTITTDIAPGNIGDTEIAVYREGIGFNCSDMNTLTTQLGCDQNSGTIIGSGEMAVLSLNCLTPGAFYYIQVDGGNASTGNFCIEVSDDGFFSVVSASSASVTSDATCFEGSWTHYYNSSTNQILLSLNIGSTGAIIPDDGVTVDADGGVDVFWVPSVPGNFVDNETGAAFMKRKWNVIPTTPPIGPVGVRFYYTTAEYDAINAEIVNQSGTPLTGHSDLRFFKITNGSDPFAVGTLLAADGIDLSNGAPSTTSWQYGTYNGQHYGEFMVDGFSGGGIGGVPGNAALPVELVSFTGKEMDNYNLLEWVTASEFNTKMFIIERSADGVNNFEAIGQLPATGNSNQLLNYQLQDKTPLVIGFYRLKIVDFDGKQQFSNIISIKRKDGQGSVFNIFPVPAKDKLTVEFVVSTSGSVNFTLTDVVGKVLFEIKTNAAKGLNVEAFDLGDLQAGVYILIFEHEGERIVRRVVRE